MWLSRPQKGHYYFISPALSATPKAHTLPHFLLIQTPLLHQNKKKLKRRSPPVVRGMALQHHHPIFSITKQQFQPSSPPSTSILPTKKSSINRAAKQLSATIPFNRRLVVVKSSSSGLQNTWEKWVPASQLPCLSDILWPSAGAFAAMALLGRLDQMVAPRGLSFTVAPLGAVCVVLFTAPNSPAAQKYNMFVAQIGCAALGVLALVMFGPGWLARATALAASIAFMTVTGASHPPAASLPIMFIDAAKLHHLNLWYALFPGATGCLLLCLIQEMVIYLKNNYKF